MTQQDEFVPEIFAPLGGMAPKCSDADMQRMEPKRRKLYEHAHKCGSECEALETAIRDGEQDIRALQKAIDAKKKEVTKYCPPLDAFDIWKRDVKRLPPDPVDPEREAAADAAQAEADALEVELQTKRDALTFAKSALPSARKRQGAAWADYTSAFPRISQSEALHAHAQAEMRRRALNVSEGRPAESNRTVAAPEYASNVDAIRANMKGPIGSSRSVGGRPGSFPASMRNRATTPPKQRA